MDIEIETLSIRIKDQAETTVPLKVRDRSEPSIHGRACVLQVLQTEGQSEESVVPNERLEKNSREVEELVELAPSDLQDGE